MSDDGQQQVAVNRYALEAARLLHDGRLAEAQICALLAIAVELHEHARPTDEP